jgi:hypothetical protein
MAALVKFTRTKNRTADDVYKNMILPKLPLVLNDACQKITYYNKHNHTYKNRTGACENSVSWIPPVTEGAVVKAAVIAGGLSKATQTQYYAGGGAHTIRSVTAKGKKLRYKKVAQVTRGMQILVNYAIFLERKGYPVLKQGIEYFRPKLTKQFAGMLKLTDVNNG